MASTSEDVAVEGIERGVVDVGCENALFEIVEHHDAGRAAQTSKRAFVELCVLTSKTFPMATEEYTLLVAVNVSVAAVC